MQNTSTVTEWLKENAKDWRTLIPQSGGTVFTLHGTVTTNTKGEKRLIAGVTYTICSDTEGTYLQGTSMIPGFEISHLHEGAEKTAWAFTMKPQNFALKGEAALEAGECVRVGISDDKRTELGEMSMNLFSFSSYCFGVTGNCPAHLLVRLILEYVP